jgi:hypothetical protein
MGLISQSIRNEIDKSLTCQHVLSNMQEPYKQAGNIQEARLLYLNYRFSAQVVTF